MTYSTWKMMRKMNRHPSTLTLEKLGKKVQFQKILAQKSQQSKKIIRSSQFGLRSTHQKPNRFVAGHAVDVMKYGVDRVGWV